MNPSADPFIAPLVFAFLIAGSALCAVIASAFADAWHELTGRSCTRQFLIGCVLALMIAASAFYGMQQLTRSIAP